MIKRKGMGYLHGLMGGSMRDCGKMASSMDVGYMLVLMGSGRKANGIRANGLDGLRLALEGEKIMIDRLD